MTTVILTSEAAEQLEELELPIHARVLKILERLEQWPNVSGAKPLKGDLAGKVSASDGRLSSPVFCRGEHLNGRKNRPSRWLLRDVIHVSSNHSG